MSFRSRPDSSSLSTIEPLQRSVVPFSSNLFFEESSPSSRIDLFRVLDEPRSSSFSTPATATPSTLSNGQTSQQWFPSEGSMLQVTPESTPPLLPSSFTPAQSANRNHETTLIQSQQQPSFSTRDQQQPQQQQEEEAEEQQQQQTIPYTDNNNTRPLSSPPSDGLTSQPTLSVLSTVVADAAAVTATNVGTRQDCILLFNDVQPLEKRVNELLESDSRELSAAQPTYEDWIDMLQSKRDRLVRVKLLLYQMIALLRQEVRSQNQNLTARMLGVPSGVMQQWLQSALAFDIKDVVDEFRTALLSPIILDVYECDDLEQRMRYEEQLVFVLQQEVDWLQTCYLRHLHLLRSLQ